MQIQLEFLALQKSSLLQQQKLTGIPWKVVWTQSFWDS